MGAWTLYRRKPSFSIQIQYLSSKQQNSWKSSTLMPKYLIECVHFNIFKSYLLTHLVVSTPNQDALAALKLYQPKNPISLYQTTAGFPAVNAAGLLKQLHCEDNC